MVKIKLRQNVEEITEYELTESQMRDFRKIEGQHEKVMYLDDIGGSPAEYESTDKFRFEVEK
ncbi:MAG: hypothetical protein M0Q91_12765 [Methanoregula sp.]|jgi:hypothetical protein|nr:hypothetical protein [Methanoregula sp.]